MSNNDDAVPYKSTIMYRAPDGNPEWKDDPWTTLSVYQSRDLLSERFEYRHQRKLGEAKAQEIASHLRQGSQFFSVAKDAGDLASPLLLYYGVLALSRAVVLFAHASLRETSLSGSHGLEATGWSNLLTHQGGARNIPGIKITVSNGTFLELVNATQNREWTQVEWENDLPHLGGSEPLSGHVGWMAGSRAMDRGDVIEFDELIKRIPDLAYLYEEVFGRQAACFPTEIRVIRGPYNLGPCMPAKFHQVRLRVLRNRQPLPEASKLLELLALSQHGYIASPTHPDASRYFSTDIGDDKTLTETFPPVRINKRHADYVVAPWLDGKMLGSLPLLFVAAYATGMLVRYYPTVWQSMMSIRTGDRVFPVLLELVAHVHRQFPIGIAEFLERRYLPTGVLKELPTGLSLPPDQR